MAWRPYDNLIDGELDNRVPGKVTGWMRFFRQGQEPLKVVFDLDGDFHEDIRGKRIVLRNPQPSESYDGAGRDTYMKGFAPLQRGTAGDITAGRSLGPWTEALADRLKAQLEIGWAEAGISGPELERQRREVDEQYRKKIAAGELYFEYVDYPYIEWYSDNGRVVLELDPSHIEVVDAREDTPPREKTPEELSADRKRRAAAFGAFMIGMTTQLSEQSRREGGDGNVTSVVIGRG